MRRTLLVIILSALAVGGISLAHHDEHGKGGAQVKLLSQKDIIEKLDGKKAKATMVEVTLAPGEVEAAHRLPRPGVRVRPGGRVRVGHRQQQAQGLQGRRHLLRADRLPARRRQEPQQDEQGALHRHCPAPGGRQGRRHPRKEKIARES
jgi:hypothetical protein